MNVQKLVKPELVDGQEFKKLLRDFDVIREVVGESIFDDSVYFALLKSIETDRQEDLLIYAQKQVEKVKEYIQDKAEENELLNQKLVG